MSWRSTRVQVMKKMLSRHDGIGAYQMYIKIIPIKHIKYEAVANSITCIWLHINSRLIQITKEEFHVLYILYKLFVFKMRNVSKENIFNQLHVGRVGN
jgi:hypothetical protein